LYKDLNELHFNKMKDALIIETDKTNLFKSNVKIIITKIELFKTP